MPEDGAVEEDIFSGDERELAGSGEDCVLDPLVDFCDGEPCGRAAPLWCQCFRPDFCLSALSGVDGDFASGACVPICP